MIGKENFYTWKDSQGRHLAFAKLLLGTDTKVTHILIVSEPDVSAEDHFYFAVHRLAEYFRFRDDPNLYQGGVIFLGVSQGADTTPKELKATISYTGVKEFSEVLHGQSDVTPNNIDKLFNSQDDYFLVANINHH